LVELILTWSVIELKLFRFDFSTFYKTAIV